MPAKFEQMKNILELKSIKIKPEKVQTLEAAQRIPKLKGYDLRPEYFEAVYHPQDLIEHLAYYEEAKTYKTTVPVSDIKGTTHPSYYGLNWLQMLMNLERHKKDKDEESVSNAINNTQCFEPIQLSKFGNIYFINGGGNHRVCQAKFLGMETVPAEVTEWEFTTPPVSHMSTKE